MRNDRADITWAPRVSLVRIRQLYTHEALGIADEELVDEVGSRLLARCQSIMEFTAAVRDRTVRCKRCSNQGVEMLLQRLGRMNDEVIRCPVCGWQIRWRVYVQEGKKTGGYLEAGNAGAAFQRYIDTYPRCQTKNAKILAIDQLIHDFHWILVPQQRDEAFVGKPAGVNLLQGSTTQVLELLDNLSYSQTSTSELLEERQKWREKVGRNRALK